ncbi:uncharacterized protein [Lolium perenne]|uniref:uncharacterized protein n=1 Tax=Lolium perenne TaxID=4522 RepID=UPI0021F59D99|nr:uncharacterized protein LOC127330702 [Lolium perenne]
MAQSLTKNEEMAQKLKKYRLGYQKCTPPWECFVRDSSIMHNDFDGTLMKLFEGTYQMGPVTSKCLIQKFKDGDQLNQYRLLKDLRHPSIVSVENCYEEKGCPRFVLSWVDGSLTAWLKKDGSGKMFKSTMKGSAPTGAMRQMIFDLCRGLQHLLDEKLYPINIGRQDICVCRLGHKAVAKLLVNKVEKLRDLGRIEARTEQLWDEMRMTLYDICKQAAVSLDPLAEMFLMSIGVQNVTRLQSYPDQWDFEKKARFLLSLMSEDITVILPLVQAAPIEWPKTPKGRVRSPFYEMLEHEAKTPGGRTYDLNEPFDYLRLCKNMIKHWTVLPQSVKAECSTVEELINKMERCNRLIWCILYDATASITEK